MSNKKQETPSQVPLFFPYEHAVNAVKQAKNNLPMSMGERYNKDYFKQSLQIKSQAPRAGNLQQRGEKDKHKKKATSERR